MTHAVVLPGPVVLRDPLPAGWVRCPELGCGARAGHEPPHVPEAVPPVPLSATGTSPVSARPIAVSATRCPCALGPDLACPEHGEALRAWQKENGT